MESRDRGYGLAFVPTQGKEPPAVAIVLARSEQVRFEHALATYLERSPLTDEVLRRLGRNKKFSPFESWPAFGYGRCGWRVAGDTEVEYRVRFRGPAQALPAALTIETLLTAAKFIAYGGFEKRPPKQSNRQQLFDVEFGPALSGRQALGGSFDPPTAEWFVRRGAEGPPQPKDAFAPEAFCGHPLKDDYPRMAMRQAWRAVTPRHLRRFDEHCAVTVKPTGHFALICLGANVATFPDITPSMDEGFGGRFTDWNLDSLTQLLTMFAGLCALYQTIAKDLG